MCVFLCSSAYILPHYQFINSFEFGPDVYENFRADPMAFFEQLDTMEPGDQSRSLRMIQAFIDLQEEAGGKIDFKGCVRIAFNRMLKDFRTSILDLSHSADEMEKVCIYCSLCIILMLAVYILTSHCHHTSPHRNSQLVKSSGQAQREDLVQLIGMTQFLCIWSISTPRQTCMLQFGK